MLYLCLFAWTLGSTALHVAAEYGHLNVAKAFACADPRCIKMKDKKGRDVLRVATENKKEQIVDFLQQFQSGTSSFIYLIFVAICQIYIDVQG